MDNYDEILRSFEGWDATEKIEQFTRDHVYIEEHWEELLEQYPDKWIAVLRGELIASADSIEALVKDIPKQDRGSTVNKFMDTDPKPQFLVAA